MNATRLCQHCGAPWQPDVTGACRFCRVVAPPDPPAGRVAAGVAGAGPGARPVIDADSLYRRLMAMTADPARPLDRLADGLRQVAGDRVGSTAPSRGAPIPVVTLSLDDWRYQAQVDHGDVAGLATHSVRGVVLKRQPMPFDEWLACVAGHLADYAGTHPHVYQAIVGLKPA